MEFKDITPSSMAEIWPILSQVPTRTTDFSYGGVLMWVDYFNYRYCIEDDTLFIKGLLENDRSSRAFSLPVGKLPLRESISRLKAYCREKGWPLELSAVPSESLEELKECGAVRCEELADWGDYLYSANALATLSGNKLSKKRNRFNKFDAEHPDWHLDQMTPANVNDALRLMDEIEGMADVSEEARDERCLTRKMLEYVREGNPVMVGGILYAGGEPCAFTLGDVKGDTLFIHIEKAKREVSGSYEAINKVFAEAMLAMYPGIEYVNREDDAGDMGLRIAKESYHPLEKLAKYNVVF